MNKKLLGVIVILSVIFTGAILLAACETPALSVLVVSVNGSEHETSYDFGEFDVGSAPSLAYKVVAKYDDGSKKELTSSDYATEYRFNGQVIASLPSAYNDAGDYSIIITYQGRALTLSFQMGYAKKAYQTVLVGKTQWAYGDEQPEIKLSDSSVSVGENDLYCIEKSKVANSDNLTSEEFANARTYYKEFALDPGEYYLFIKVPQTGSFAEAYSSLKEVKVIKATPTVENASLLKATYTYSSYAPVFGKIKSSELTFKEDGPVVKLGAEEFQAITWKFEDKELDSANNGETVKLIFTLEEGYEKYYNTPAIVNVPLEINKGVIDKPVIAEHGYAVGQENLIDIYVGEQGVSTSFDWNACSLSMTKPNGVAETIDITAEHETHIYLDRQTKAGTYTYTLSLIDKTNYAWTDGTWGDVTKQIVIAGDDLTGKSMVFTDMKLLDANGDEVTEEVDGGYLTMTESMRSANLGLVNPETGDPVNENDAVPATVKAEANGTVSGTCDFGGGTFDNLIADGTPYYYTYDASRANTVEIFAKDEQYDVVIEESKLVGNLAENTLTLTMRIYNADSDGQADTGLVWTFTFTIAEIAQN